MKMRFLCLTIAAILLFTSSSPWEGAAAVAPAGEIPETGRYVATNSFPPHTIVEIRNIENSRSTHAIVVRGLDSPGLLALVSREVAQILGMRAGSISRVRMLQPSDPMAYLRFTESLTPGLNLNTADHYASEEELLARLYGDDTYVPPAVAQTAQVPDLSHTVPLVPPAVPSSVIERGYIVDEPEWGGTGRLSIIDIPQFEIDPLSPPVEIAQPQPQTAPVKPATEPATAPVQIAEPKPAAEPVYTRAEPVTEPAIIAHPEPVTEPVIVQRPEPVTEPVIVQRPEPVKETVIVQEPAPVIAQIPEPVTEPVREEVPAVKDDPVYITQNDREEIIKDSPQRYEETPSTEIVKEAPLYNPEEILDSVNKDTPLYVTELPRDEIIKDIAEREEYLFEDEYTVVEKPVYERPVTEPPIDEPRFIAEAAVEPLFTAQPPVERPVIQPRTPYTLVQTDEQPPQNTIYGIDPNNLIPGVSTPSVSSAPVIPSVVVTQPLITPSIPSAVNEQSFSVQTISRLDNGQYYVQLAALPENLVENTIRLIDRRYNPVVYKDSDNLYRVLIGPLNHGESAAVLQRFRTIGFSDAFVRRGA